MKRFFVFTFIIIFSLHMVCCGINSENDITVNSVTNVSSASTKYSENDILENIQFTVNKNCLPENSDKSDDYNNAIRAYNAFLAKRAEEILPEKNSYNGSHASFFTTIKDLENDGIPEILVYDYYIYPQFVYGYRNGEVVNLPDHFSSGWHGKCGLLENGMYRSEHHSTGWRNTFVTYNKDGTQTIEEFSEYNVYKYKRYTVKLGNDKNGSDATDYYSVEFNLDAEGKEEFYKLYKPYEEALKHFDYSGEQYSPFEPDMSFDYPPDILEKIEKRYWNG